MKTSLPETTFSRYRVDFPLKQALLAFKILVVPNLAQGLKWRIQQLSNRYSTTATGMGILTIAVFAFRYPHVGGSVGSTARASRIWNANIARKVMLVDEAAALIPNGANVGMSGFTGSVYLKALPAAIARLITSENARGELQSERMDRSVDGPRVGRGARGGRRNWTANAVSIGSGDADED